MKREAIAVVMLAVSHGAVAGGVYKWVDEQGQVHYGDRPAGATAQAVDIAPAPAPTADVSEEARRAKQLRLLGAMREERVRKQEEQRRSEAEAKQRQRNCVWARHQLQAHNDAGSVYELDDQGERRFLSKAERERATEKAREQVRVWCEERP